MELNLVNEVAALQRLSIGPRRQGLAELFGETTQTTNASNRIWLVKSLFFVSYGLALRGDLRLTVHTG